MRFDKFHRSENVEDFRDPNKPVEKLVAPAADLTINEMIKLTDSQLAEDAGSKDIKPLAVAVKNTEPSR